MNGQAHGAVTILNATATGRGCSMAIDAATEATWHWGGSALAIEGAPDARLADACWRVAQARLGRDDGASIRIRSDLPHARGLKTSSSAATAMLRAAGLPEADVEVAAVDAARQAGVTLTGAFDDQVAVTRGGCHLTDNGAMQVIARFPVEPWHVAIWVPDEPVPKSRIAAIDASGLRPAIEAAEARLLADDIPDAMTRNGAAFSSLYAAAGVPVTEDPARVALHAGAVGAGLSGTGPAIAALFDAPADLPPVEGGVWRWHRTVEVP